MQVMTFGASCSPCSAQYVKNINAEQHASEFPRAAKAIIEHHYVDDYLDSVNTADEAIQLAKEVQYIHRKGGFEIRNWLSNSERVVRVLENIQPDDMKILSDDVDKVLGIWWCRKLDAFTYSLKLNNISNDILDGSRRPTKREVLRTLMSVFDPLGFLAIFMVFVKILLQEIWRSNIMWEEQIADEQNEKWRKMD